MIKAFGRQISLARELQVAQMQVRVMQLGDPFVILKEPNFAARIDLAQIKVRALRGGVTRSANALDLILKRVSHCVLFTQPL